MAASLCNFQSSAREQSRLFDLLGRINYKILTGKQVYVQTGGVVYKTVYGGLLAQRLHGHRTLLVALRSGFNPRCG
jgi:hypothetical protein